MQHERIMHERPSSTPRGNRVPPRKIQAGQAWISKGDIFWFSQYEEEEDHNFINQPGVYHCAAMGNPVQGELGIFPSLNAAIDAANAVGAQIEKEWFED